MRGTVNMTEPLCENIMFVVFNSKKLKANQNLLILQAGFKHRIICHP